MSYELTLIKINLYDINETIKYWEVVINKNETVNFDSLTNAQEYIKKRIDEAAN